VSEWRFWFTRFEPLKKNRTGKRRRNPVLLVYFVIALILQCFCVLLLPKQPTV